MRYNINIASYRIRKGTYDGLTIDISRVFETATALSAIVPTFSGATESLGWAMGSALVSAEASALIASGVIVAKK